MLRLVHGTGAARAVAPPVSDTMITLGRLGIVVTILAWFVYITVTIISQFVNRGFQGMQFTSETAGYVVIVSFLTLSSLLFGFMRSGGINMEMVAAVPTALVVVIQGLIVITLAGATLFIEKWERK